MSAPLTQLRESLAAAIAAEPTINLTTAQIICRRKANVWNEIALALQDASAQLCLHIATPEASADREGARKSEVTLALTLMEAQPTAETSNDIEETAAKIISFVERAASVPPPGGRQVPLAYHPLTAGWRMKAYAETEISDPDGEAIMPGIQMTFTRTLSIV